MLSEVENGEALVDERARRRGEHDLPTRRRRSDSRSAVDVVADIALLSDERRTRVHADAYEDRAVCEPPSERRCRGECRGRRWKGEEEGVALRIDLNPSLDSAGVADQSAMLSERPTVPVLAEPAEEHCRSFDIGEEKSDGAAREVLSHDEIICRIKARVQ